MTKIRVPQRSRTVTAVLLDVRADMKKTILRGKMQLPLPLCEAGQHARFPIPEFKCKPTGMVCDVTPHACTLVFPFIDPTDGQHIKGHILSTEEIIDLFQKFEPRLKKVKQK